MSTKYRTTSFTPINTNTTASSNTKIETDTDTESDFDFNTDTDGDTTPSLNLTSVPRHRYDPAVQALHGKHKRKLWEVVHSFESPAPVPKGKAKVDTWITVRLTAYGNAKLWERCKGPKQKEVWRRYPCYDFVMREGALSEEQILTGRPSYINAILIASRGKQMAVPCTRNKRRLFRDSIRIPGIWLGACAGCKWLDRAKVCGFNYEDRKKYTEEPWKPARKYLADVLREKDVKK
ncbi:hypothetical protein BJX66DRAFT_309806 [Aspergillus keveii]|uniref:Uncharacterized protein n=1 Tax=Aspergillus keveii TaxID=714993 RepID=A0ABR4FXJ4_9EURO